MRTPSRPLLALSAVALAVLAGCSSSTTAAPATGSSAVGATTASGPGSSAAGSSNAATRAGDAGSSAAPGATAGGDPGVVVALDDFAALNALSVGVVPDVVFDAFGYETSRAIFAAEGITPIPYGASLNLEQVIGADPDLIIGVSLPTTVEQQAALEKVALTVIFDYTADWRTQLEQTAGALGRPERAASIAAAIDQRAAALDAAIDGEPVVSVLSFNQTAFSVPAGSGLGTLLDEAGLARPAAQSVATAATQPFIDVSLETLPDHDGDAIMLMTGQSYDPAPLTQSPLWPTLSAVQNDDVHEVNAELWFGASPVAIDWILRDLQATLVDGSTAGTAADAVTRYRAFLDS